jgi:hypothetical protein
MLSSVASVVGIQMRFSGVHEPLLLLLLLSSVHQIVTKFAYTRGFEADCRHAS